MRKLVLILMAFIAALTFIRAIDAVDNGTSPPAAGRGALYEEN